MFRAQAYYSSYSKALFKFINNGFFARDLDADDHAFLESVRERRCLSCGSLAEPAVTACTYSDDIVHRVALAEEMEFWQQPYQVDKIVVRRHGPVERKPPRLAGSTPHAEQRKRNQELAAAERADELRQLEERRREQLRRDIEWEKAAPKRKLKFGKIKGRHYVPQWKVDELEAKTAAEQKAHEEAQEQYRQQSLQAAQEAMQNAQEAQALATAEAKALEASKQIETTHRRAAAERASPWLAAVQQSRRQQLDILLRQQPAAAQHHEYKKAKIDVTAFEAEQQRQQQEKISVLQLQNLIMIAMHETYPRIVTLEELMAATGCQDKAFFIQCADELVSSGRLLHRMEEAAA